MALHTVKTGLNLPIAGEPAQRIEAGRPVSRVAITAEDYIGLKPTMFVEEGAEVLRGQSLMEDKKNPGVVYTAPGAGRVVAVNRGKKRALLSVVIELNERERTGNPSDEDFVSFESYKGSDVSALSRDDIQALLVESGMWTCLRTRPFGKVAAPGKQPDAIFVTAVDSNPLAPNVDVVLAGNEDDFRLGLNTVAKLTSGATFVCVAPGSKVPVSTQKGIRYEEFAGKHPCGTVGYHIHTLRPVNREREVWHLHYQDVIAVGRLLRTGKLDVERVVSLAGPQVKNPHLVRTRWGAHLGELCEGALKEGDNRTISGSIWSGRTAVGDVTGYLGRFALQVCVMREGHEREFLGWLTPGLNRFSTLNIYISRLFKGKKFDFTTTTNGSERAMVPLGTYEEVMPFDLMPTYLLRAIISGDVEKAEMLGVMELDEEDLALCTFVCPGKYEYGPLLRGMLTDIEKEG